MRWYFLTIKNYFNFIGRARRKEYWMFVLFNFMFGAFIAILDIFLKTQIPALNAQPIGILSSLYGLFVFTPSISLLIRRLHDINKSGWWLLLTFVPVIGWIWSVIYTFMEGTRGYNRYGEDPKCIMNYE